MYKANEFDQKLDMSIIYKLGEKYTYSGEELELVKEHINEIISVARSSCILPDVVVHSTWFTNDADKFIDASFTVRPSLRQGTVVEHKTTFKINADAKFYERFACNLAKWSEEYWELDKLTTNLMELQHVFDEIISNADIPYRVYFKVGYGVIDVSDTEIVLGIAPEILKTLATSDLFYSYIPGNIEALRAKVGEALKSCAKPIEIVKLNSYIFKGLGIYSRKLYKGIVRATVNRKLDFSRVGDSYVDTPDYFAVIRKVAVTAEEAKAYPSDVYVIENTNASKAEIEAEKTKVAIFYKVAPFNKDNEAVTIDIKDIPNIVLANNK